MANSTTSLQDIELVEQPQQPSSSSSNNNSNNNNISTPTPTPTIADIPTTSPNQNQDDNETYIWQSKQLQPLKDTKPVQVSQGSPGLIGIILSIIFLTSSNFVQCSNDFNNNDTDMPKEGLFQPYDGLNGRSSPMKRVAQAGAISAILFAAIGIILRILHSNLNDTNSNWSRHSASNIETTCYVLAFVLQLLSFTFVMNHPFCQGLNQCEDDVFGLSYSSGSNSNSTSTSTSTSIDGEVCAIAWGLPFAASVLYALSALAASW